MVLEAMDGGYNIFFEMGVGEKVQGRLKNRVQYIPLTNYAHDMLSKPLTSLGNIDTSTL